MRIQSQQRAGWRRDMPSHEDYTISRPWVQRMLRRLPRDEPEKLPDRADLRAYCRLVVDQGDLLTGTTHACVALAQYYVMRVQGKLIQPSRAFLHQNACRLDQQSTGGPTCMRTTLKSMLRFGLPPERYLPYQTDHLAGPLDAFLYGFPSELAGCRYMRLDPAGQSGDDTLALLKAFLHGGFAMSFGFSMPESPIEDGEIHYPSSFEQSSGAHAVLCVGYDDQRRIRSEKGALLIQNSWGPSWGERGFGWLPYRYVIDRLAVDFWLLLKRSWIKTGEFTRPIGCIDS